MASGVSKNGGMVFISAAFVYLVALIAVTFCFFFAFYTLLCIDELKADYMNPIDQCKSLNRLVLPEYTIHIVFSLLFPLSAQMIATIINLPLAICHVITYWRRPLMSSRGLYDPTTIMNRDQLNGVICASWVKVAFYIISFLYYLYALICITASS